MSSAGSERTTFLGHSDVEDTQLSTVDTKLPSERCTPLPKAIYIVLLLAMATPLTFELIFPFVNQMILEIGVVDDPERVGFYSGIIESIFAAMSFLTIMPSSVLSDRYGRKPIIIASTAGLAVSTALFGMSTSFGMMVVTRCIGGTLAGSWAAMKIMIGEMTDKSNQHNALALLAVFYRIGQIVGQPLGGYLVHPEKSLSLFQTQFWYNYPFALPCFVSAAFTLVLVVLAGLVLEETLPSKRKGRKTSSRSSAQHYGSTSVMENGSSGEASSRTQKPEMKRPSVREVLTPQVIAVVVSTAGMVFASETLFALYPLFAFTPIISGGLGLSEAQIGTHVAARAIISIFVMSLYARLRGWFGTLRLYRMTMALWPVCIIFFPYLNHVARQNFLAGAKGSLYLDAMVGLCFVVWSFAALSWTGVLVMSNDVCPSAAALATVNGISQMAISLPQAFSPAFVTTMFAYSLKSRIFGGNLIWIVLISASIAAFLHSFSLKEASHDWRTELSDDEGV